MITKSILAVAAAAAFSSAMLVAAPADAMGMRGGMHAGGGMHSGGGMNFRAGIRTGGLRTTVIRGPRLVGRIPDWRHRHHHHWRFRWGYAVPVVGAVGVAAVGVAAVRQGPCTCLTKEYTPEGLVIFKDLCTKEMASAPVPGSPAAAAAEAEKTSSVQPVEQASPTNFAGKTFEEYQAAQQAGQPTARN